MGVLLSLMADTGELCFLPLHGGYDRKCLASEISKFPDAKSTISRLLAYFGLEFEPFTKRTWEEYTLEQWMDPSFNPEGEWSSQTVEYKAQRWREHQTKIESAYQDPAIFLTVLRPFIHALESHPEMYEVLGIEDRYFTSGGFVYHLKHLQHEFEFAQRRGITRIRLQIG
jgi:hypothetical protein